jgi:pimeloyl-ACP methyl ester carboxylesterase
MVLLQLVLFCALFTLMVKLAVGNSALNGLYFYPKPVQERVYALGLTDRETVARKRKRFMIPFFLVMLAALVLIVGLWNGIRSFQPAYLQALLFLEVMNWYDGIVIDRLWVGHSRFWIIPGTEDLPFVQTWQQVLRKRGILTLIWIAGAAVVAGLIVLIF